MEHLETLTFALGVSLASGINLYATVVILGVLDALSLVSFPEHMKIMFNPLVIGLATLLYAAEFLADKIPGIDTLWDLFHTYIRIPAGGLLAMLVTQELDMGFVAEIEIISAVLFGCVLAAGSHAIKSGIRVIINTSPEPITNWTASFLEDILVLIGVFSAIFNPIFFLVFLGVFILVITWILPKIWKGIRRAFWCSCHPFATLKLDPEERIPLSDTLNSP